MQIRIRDLVNSESGIRDGKSLILHKHPGFATLFRQFFKVILLYGGECTSGGGSGGRGRSHRLGAGQRPTYTGKQLPPQYTPHLVFMESQREHGDR